MGQTKRSAIPWILSAALSLATVPGALAGTSMEDSSKLSASFHACVPYSTSGRTESCSPGYAGSREYVNTFTCAGAYGWPVAAGEALYSDTCTPLTPCVPHNDPWSTACGTGFSGTISYLDHFTCASTYATPRLLGGSSTKVLAMEIYDLAIGYLEWNEAAALATILFLLIGVVVWGGTRLVESGRRRAVFE